jgi:hypothetical protein
VGNGAWIKSPICASQVQNWLAQHHVVAADLIIQVEGLMNGLAAPAVGKPDKAKRDQVWAAVTAGCKVPPSAGEDGCEYLAHAVCELISAQFPDLARLHLKKIWQVAPDLQLHPPQNWKHHVAPVLSCQDGEFALDLFLSPNGPVAKASWIQLATGTGSSAGVQNLQQAWEARHISVMSTMPSRRRSPSTVIWRPPAQTSTAPASPIR